MRLHEEEGWNEDVIGFPFPENISLNLGGSGRGAASSDSFVLNSFVWPHAVVTPQ